MRESAMLVAMAQADEASGLAEEVAAAAVASLSNDRLIRIRNASAPTSPTGGLLPLVSRPYPTGARGVLSQTSAVTTPLLCCY